MKSFARHCEGGSPKQSTPSNSPKGGELLPSLLGRGWGRGGLLRACALAMTSADLEISY